MAILTAPAQAEYGYGCGAWTGGIDDERERLATAGGWPCLLCCGLAAQALPWAVQVRNAAGQPLADAAVAVEIRGRPPRRRRPRPSWAQRERQFTPRLLDRADRHGGAVPEFRHRAPPCLQLSPIKVFETKLYSGTPAEPIVFDKPGVATLGCNIHDRMSAHIRRRRHGRVRPDRCQMASRNFELPAGEHQVKLWHAGLKAPGPAEPGLDGDWPAGGGQSQLSLSE